MSSLEFDLSEVAELAADLAAAPNKVVTGSRAVLQKGALNVKNQLRREAEGVGHAPAFPSSITYDTRELAGSTVAEIGPVKGGAGSLALLYLGNSKTGPRLPDPLLAVNAEAPSMAEFLAKLGGESVE